MKFIYRYLVFIALLVSYQGRAQIGLKLGTSPGTLATNSILDLSGTTNRGLLLPRIALTATNSISPLSGTVTSGMLVYNTATAGTSPNNVTPGIYYYNGSIWERVTSSSTFQATNVALTSATAPAGTNTGQLIYNTATGITGVPVGLAVWNGSSWVSLVTSNLYTASGTLTGDRIVTQGTNTLAFTSSATTGTSHFTVDGTTLNVDAVNNRVGIGTASPARVLHTFGDAVRFDRFGGAPGSTTTLMPQALFVNTDGTTVYKTWVSGMANETMDYVISDYGTLVGATSGTQRLVISGENGNVGIGTSLPAAKLHVTDGSVLLDVNENTASSTRHVLVRGNTTPTDYTTPGTAALDVSSKSRGFLPPRMTAKQIQDIPFGSTSADSLKSEGLVVYCTDCVPKTIMVFDGKEWLDLLGNGFPKNITPPVVSSKSTAIDTNGKINVETTDGEWLPETGLNYTYKWFKRSSGSTSFGVIVGETGTSIDITPVNGDSYQCEVSVWGSISVSSNIYTVPASAVSISTTPIITAYGNFYEVSTAGAATNASTSYSWEYQTVGGTWTTISNASGLTYNASDTYYGRPIRVKFTASNLLSTSSVTSNQVSYAPLFDQGAISSTVRALYSVRKLRTAYAGNALRVQNRRTNVTTEIGFNSSGNLNTTTLTSALTASNDTLVVMVWYDQSGNGRHAIAPSEDEAPAIVLGGQIQYLTGSRPTIVFDGDNDVLKVSAGLPMSVSSGIEMLFALRQNQPSTSDSRNGGIMTFSDISLTNNNENQHFGKAPTRSTWWDTFASTNTRNTLTNVTTGLESQVDRGRNYVGSVRHNGTGAAIRATLNADEYTNKFHHYRGTSNSTIDTSIAQLWIGTIVSGFASQNNYSEIFIVQSLPSSKARQNIFRSLGGFYGISIGSNGSN